MKYMGSKARISKELLEVILKYNSETNQFKIWNEPFVGGANMIDKVPSYFEKHGYDINEYLIEFFKESQKNFIPKEYYSREEYDYIKNNKDEDKCTTGYVGINCSYSGKWFGGFAGVVKTKNGIRDYQSEARRNVLLQIQNLKYVEFKHSNYLDLSFKDSVIYCDPPYKGTTKYDIVDDFEHETFYEWCRVQVRNNNILFLSEYSAPDDFQCVWEKTVNSSLSANGTSGHNKKSVEKLFMLK